MKSRTVRTSLGLGVAAVALTACAIPGSIWTVTQHDFSGHPIQCTYQSFYHPDIPLDGLGWWEHRFISGPPACTGN